MTSSEPARIWGLRGKGSWAVGADADLTLWRLDGERRIDETRLHGRNNLSPFRGEQLRGYPAATVIRGRVVMRDGETVGSPDGRPIGRAPPRP